MITGRRWTAAAVSLIALMLAVPNGAYADASTAPAAVQESALQELGACLAAEGKGDLLLLVDQSGSLRQTDPTATRVRAAAYLLQQLAAATARGGQQLDVAAAGFDAGYQRVIDWQPLSQASVPSLTEGLGQFAARHTGFDTDYANALAGARDELQQRAQSGPRCQAVLWFTDGRFDIGPRMSASERQQYGTTKEYAPGITLTDKGAAAQVEQAGRTAMCRDGGTADQLRAAGVLTLAIGLGTAADDFGLLRSLATGTDVVAGGCGRAPTTTVGDFRLASDLDDLFFAIDADGDPQQLPSTTAAGICQRLACAERAHRFVLDLSVRQVHVLAGADRAGIQVLLRAPSGASTPFTFTTADPANVIVDGQQVTARWLSDRTLDVSLVRQVDATWPGEWAVTFVDPAGSSPDGTSRTQVRITGDLVPTVVNAGTLELRSGSLLPVQLGLVSEATGKPVDAAGVLGSATTSAQLMAADGKVVPLAQQVPADQLTVPRQLDLASVTPGDATLRLTLALRTADAPATAGRAAAPGTQLANRVVDVPVTVLPPLHYPTVSSSLSFGRIQGLQAHTAALQVTGPGCIWVDGTVVGASPDGVGTVTVTSTFNSANNCLRLAEGQKAEIPVRLTVQHPGNGTVAGKVTAHLAPPTTGDPVIATPVSFLGDLVRPVDAGVRTAVFLLALILGLGLPIAFLYAAKWWTARIPGRTLLAGTVAVSVSEDAVLRGDDPLTFSHLDVSAVPVSRRGARNLALPGGLQLRTRTGLNPTAPGRTRVLPASRDLVTSTGGEDLPLAVHNCWIARSSNAAETQADVTVLVSAGAGPDVYARLAEDVRRRLPDHFTRMRVDQDVPPPPVEDGWGRPADAASPGIGARSLSNSLQSNALKDSGSHDEPPESWFPRSRS